MARRLPVRGHRLRHGRGAAVSGELLPASFDGEVIHGVHLRGKAAAALERLQSGEAIDPDTRRDPGAAKYHQARLSENTRRAYLRWIKQYIYFCGVMGRREVPATAETLEHFIRWVAELQPAKGKNMRRGYGMSPNSLRQALSAVHAFHDAARAAWPSTKPALGVIEGHEILRGEPGTGIRDDEGVPPIKLPTLLQLIRACPVDTNAGVRDRALLGLGFVMMARRSELSIIDEMHVTEQHNGSLRVHVPKTKTQRTKGRVAFVPRWDQYPDICPARALRAWTRRRRELGITDGPYFRAVDKWDHVLAEHVPYAGRSETMRMDPVTVELVIARAAANAIAAGETVANAAALRPHGLRAGGATSAYEAGADILAIARQGGWGDKSPVVFRYIREVDLEQRNPMRNLFGTP